MLCRFYNNKNYHVIPQQLESKLERREFVLYKVKSGDGLVRDAPQFNVGVLSCSDDGVVVQPANAVHVAQWVGWGGGGL